MPPEEKWWIVLADFGISKRADESSGPTTAIKGTATFMAPELLGYLDQVRPKSIADFKAADMWALGEIIFQMLTGETAFRSPVELMTYCNAQREFPSNRLPISATDDGHEFVTSLMMALPQDRITTTQCIQHRWLESLRVEEELAALNLEQSSPPVPEISSNETASAQWSRLSNLEHTHTETTAQRRPTTPTHLGSSDIRQTRLKSISSSPPIQQYLNTDQEPLTFAITPMQTLKDHIGWVKSVTFSHDSTRLASGSGDSTVKIWDASSGACLQTLKGHSDCVNSVAFSHNSTWLASGSGDRTVKIWDTSSGACLQTLKGHSHWVNSVVFSHNSTWLASGSSDRTVKIWDASSGACLQTLKGHKHWVNSVAFSHNSTRLASGSSDRTVKIWDASSGARLQTLKGHSDYVNSVAFSHNSTWLASGSGDRTVKIWDASSGACLQTLKGHSHWVNSVAFSHNSTWLASGSSGRAVKIWDASSGACLQTLKGHSDYVNSVAFSHNSTWLASGSSDDTVKIWSASRRSRAIATRSTQ
jgi:WD40 repeat protein